MRKAIAARVNATTDAVEREPSPQASTLYDAVYAGTHEVWV
jgi:TPP-dependent pyruvate/acetoin dehydrogenase alpha subunit